MDWTIIVFLSVLKTGLCFNIDPVAWKSWSHAAAEFGYKVVQRRSDLLVSAPLAQYSPFGRGQIYRCSPASFQKLQIQVPEYAVNMSLGLTMTSDPDTQSTLVCGPTIPKDCTSITMYNGACIKIERSNGVGPLVPPSPRDCRTQADIAFLLDGSGSVSSGDFIKMKQFVKNLVRPFVGKDAQFAVAQFSFEPQVHFYFNNFFSSGNWETRIDNILQLQGGTYTAKAIKYVVNNIFTSEHGSRSNVKRILIVITDGASNDRGSLKSAASSAEKEKIVRFAIGVGDAFSDAGAKKELQTIASNPAQNHVFQVGSFDALEEIRKNLEDQIFAIEGSQTSGDSLKLEMAQEGFSAAFVPGGIQMGVVGANEWKGGFLQYTNVGERLASYLPKYNMEPDSYLGYSMAVARTPQGTLTIIGAPRYQHRGVVLALQSNVPQKIDPFPWQFQTGEYFGAEVCAMDVNGDRYTDLVLISAPMYKDTDRDGRVYVCILTGLSVECHFDSPLVLRGDASDGGRFGSAVAVLSDLNTDGLNDVAIGAPLENDGQGSLYIFHGEGGQRISDTYSQRIAGSEVQPGLRFFGRSIGHSSFDHSGDNLPDIAVGSKGKVFLLRSRPIVMVEVTVSFSPNHIPTQNTVCSVPLKNTAQVCFVMTMLSTAPTAQAKINYTLTLDATRKPPNNRAFISGKQREKTGSTDLDLNGRKCIQVEFSIEACPDDALNEINNELKFTFDGLASNTVGLKPSLSQQAKKTTFHSLGFEINCGSDNECVDNLKVDFNFTRSLEVKVGIDELLNVTVFVENSEENSYNSQLILTYPASLSYRKFTSLQGNIECNSLDSEDGLMQGRTQCSVNKPIFKSNTEAVFIVSYGIENSRGLERRIFITANATSQNQDHSSSSDLYKTKGIDVKYSIFVTMESSLSYVNFTFGKNDLQKPLQQTILVTNDIRALNFTVVIRVPVKLGDQDVWVDSDSLQIPQCRAVTDEQFPVADFVSVVQKSKVVDCSVATCRVFRCTRFMGRLESVKYTISGNLSSNWIEQIKLPSAKFLLTSTASLEYDTNQYIFFSTGSQFNSPIHRIEAEVEVYPEPNFTKEIVGGVFGGLALLALLTAGLYKAGFFKSKYKQMIHESAEGEAADGGAPEPEPEPEQQT
ncbi:integrin alpha-M-like isoform X1 [Solea solea]|uniref:integrin alpha-M-like isoform X1 n=1 Tax=Solea solea TaxID=90069 RepID=UPI00272CFA79|nr:integrin alpha-M-like isoform X1 [Solea solea]